MNYGIEIGFCQVRISRTMYVRTYKNDSQYYLMSITQKIKSTQNCLSQNLYVIYHFSNNTPIFMRYKHQYNSIDALYFTGHIREI